MIIEHYGVLGMKWGVRKDRSSAASKLSTNSRTNKKPTAADKLSTNSRTNNKPTTAEKLSTSSNFKERFRKKSVEPIPLVIDLPVMSASMALGRKFAEYLFDS